ncbi:MAG TPA: hypothetical protein VJ719_06495 [Chthoniobacterales bacterium]|nr:hypothetical protein [Chthoniobacterales bacterium]
MRRGDYLVWGLFAAASAAGLATHEMWRDELQQWMIAVDAESITSLLANVRYEGVPPLWHLFLFGLSRLTPNPASMQIVQWLMNVSACYLILRFAPFEKYQRYLLCFSYYLLFEFGQIVRPYSVVPLLLLGVLTAASHLKRHQSGVIATGITLIGLTSLYGLVLALALATYFFILQERVTWKKIFSALLIIALAVVVLVSMRVPADAYRREWITSFSLERLLQVLYSPIWALFPIPAFRYDFWESNIIKDWALTHRDHWGVALISAVTLIAGGAFFILGKILHSLPKKTLFIFVFTTGAILFIGYFKFYGSLRHWGCIFLALLASVWLAGPFLQQRAKIYFTMFLALNAALGIHAWASDLIYLFSPAKAAASFIQRSECNRYPLAGSRDAVVSGVSAFLNRPMFYAEANQTRRFIVWTRDSKKILPKNEVADRIEKHFRSINSPRFCFLATEDWDIAPKGWSMKRVADFRVSLCPDERFSVYDVSLE